MSTPYNQGKNFHKALINIWQDKMDTTKTNFEARNKAFEEMNAILDNNGDNTDDPHYREAFKRWQEIALEDWGLTNGD